MYFLFLRHVLAFSASYKVLIDEPFLLYRHGRFTGKYTTRKNHTKPHPGLERRIFHILTSEDIDDFADIKFVS